MIESILVIELVFFCLSEMGLTGLKSRCQQDCVLSGGSKEKLISLLKLFQGSWQTADPVVIGLRSPVPGQLYLAGCKLRDIP